MARIGIAMAGIGGLAAATGLAKAGHAVTVFGQYERALPVGSGLLVQPVGLGVLDGLGVGDATRALVSGSCVWPGTKRQRVGRPRM